MIIFQNLYSETAADLSDRITIDGITEDFTSDEGILCDSLENALEHDDDSYWGEHNDIKQIKITWDSNYLYVALDACCWDNNVLLFLDIYDDYGIQDMRELNTWKRNFKFYNFNPDFFLATWDKNTNPQFWIMDEFSDVHATENTNLDDYATFDTGNLGRSMEASIPWDILYYNTYRTMFSFPSIRFLAVITAGDDYTSGPDSAPDNIGGMSNDPSRLIILDNYVEILIDADSTGSADLNIEPNSRAAYYKKPFFKPKALEVLEVSFPDGKTFCPTNNEELEFIMRPNRIYEELHFQVEIYDLQGKYIGKAEYDQIIESELYFKWDGKNKNGKFVPFGIYILRFIADTKEVSHKEAVAVIK